jgi:hypothetical protein
MGCGATCWQVLVCVTFCCTLVFVNAEDPYRFFTWNVTYGDIYPLGVKQQVCALIFVCKSCNVTILSLGCSYKKMFFLMVFCVQGILINGQFPGPDIYSVTNNNLIINVYNSLPEPCLISW